MIRGLTKVSWERIDVSFSGSKQKYLAHSTIQASILFHHQEVRFNLDYRKNSTYTNRRDKSARIGDTYF